MDVTKKIYINYEQMQGHVLELARQLYIDQWLPDYIVGITRGGLLPAALLSQYTGIPMHALKVTLRDGVEEDCDHNAWMSEDAYAGKNILVIDDINDSGTTIAWIKSDWTAGCLPNEGKWAEIYGGNVRFAVIVNNLASTEMVDYHSMEINKSEDPSWIVFPTEEWWNK